MGIGMDGLELLFPGPLAEEEEGSLGVGKGISLVYWC